MSENLQLWKRPEAARALAISERKLDELVKNNAIPVVRIGRSVRFDPQDVRGWIEAQKKSGCGGNQ